MRNEKIGKLQLVC